MKSVIALIVAVVFAPPVADGIPEATWVALPFAFGLLWVCTFAICDGACAWWEDRT